MSENKMSDSRAEGAADDRSQQQATHACSICGRSLDKRGECPQCLNKAALAQRLRVKQKVRDLFREIDRIVARNW
jgi:rubrerythrin